MKKSGVRRWGLVLAIASAWALSVGQAQAAEVEPRWQTRETLNAILAELRTDPDASIHEADLRTALPGKFRSYRFDPRPSVFPLRDSPYVGFVLLERIQQLYGDAYAAEYEKRRAQILDPIPLELLYDGLLNGYVEGSLPRSIRRQAKLLGKCLAKKSLSAAAADLELPENERKCKLDESENTTRVGVLSLIWLRLDCSVLNLVDSCTARKQIFDFIKPSLIKARAEDPDLRKSVEAEFEARFPSAFRSGFVDNITTQVKGLPGLLSSKFRGTPDLMWSERASLIESDERGDPSRISLKGFAQGLKADLGLAEWLMTVPNTSRNRGLAVALFYGVANRLLVLTGGARAKWDGKKFLEFPGQTDPKLPPALQGEGFGGWSLGQGTFGPGFGNWDWGGYDPTSSDNPTPYRIFPTELFITAAGVPVASPGRGNVQRLEDLAELLDGLVLFLKATGPGGVFENSFAPQSELAKLLDPKSPVIFPREGRSLAVGALAGVLKNLIAPGVGHLEVKAPGAPDFGLGLEFHDPVMLAGGTPRRHAESARVSVYAVARILTVASDLRRHLALDPDVPESLKGLLPQLDSALQIGALVLGAQGQNPDGTFRQVMAPGAADGTAPPEHRENATIDPLTTAIAATRAFTRAYDATETRLILFKLSKAWIALDTAWERIDRSTGRSAPLWDLLTLWNEAQEKVRPHLGPDKAPIPDWAKWEIRMNRLRTELLTEVMGQ